MREDELITELNGVPGFWEAAAENFEFKDLKGVISEPLDFSEGGLEQETVDFESE